ncbi:MAG: rod shape-determining protein RodA [Lachnospiraceae bacterium]|nr:rod shape-determining protein RodA [Lachnospiraceae bacterium]
MFHNYRIRNFNLRLVILILALTIIGIMVIGSANEDYQNKQITGMVIGLVVMTVVAIVDYQFILRFHILYYVVSLGLLVAVLFFGKTVAGAQRWLDIGVQFQPSELCKILLILFFAQFYMQFEEEINTPKTIIIALCLMAVPLFLIYKEPDLSTTIVTALIMASLFFSAGLSYKVAGTVVGVGVPTLAILINMISKEGQKILDPYQALRIQSWIYPEKYPESSYQQQNSIMAIGSGQLLGKGLNNDAFDSVKNGNYISEPQTDFIFAVAGEELGFIGCAVIILLCLFIVLECIHVAKGARDKAGELICIGMAAFVSFQSFVNICVVTGLMPNTGLPLPFVSYGQTSLVTLYGGMGIVLNVGLQSKRYPGT